MRISVHYIIMLLSLAGAVAFTSCSDDNIPAGEAQNVQKSYTITGVVQERLLSDAGGEVDTFDCYGMLVPSFTPQQLKDEGFEYADMLNIKIGDDIELQNVPFVTGFNEVGVLETCFCDYNQLNTVYGFGQLHGNFKERIGGKKGDIITVTLGKKQGYKDTWEIMKSVYDYPRSAYPELTDEEFANFREVNTTGMKRGVLYRSSNPLNPKDNAVRFSFVDSLAKNYNIQTEIDLADTKEKVNTFATDAQYLQYNIADEYCYRNLFLKDKTICLGLTADTFGETFMKTLGEGLKFMLDNFPPYLLHCNEGKDRCGFVSLLLEALAGATYQEVADDYTKTLMNFYRIQKGTESYNLRQQLSIDRLVWLLQNVDTVDDFGNIDWTDKNPQDVKLQEAAELYVQACGLTESECKQLQKLLQTGSKY